MDLSHPTLQTLSNAQTVDADPLAALLAQVRGGAMDLPLLMDAAGQFQARGQNEAAAVLYKEWLAHNPQNQYRTVALYNCGTILGTLARHLEAEAIYREALAIKPDFVQARLNLGHQLEHLSLSNEALTEWRHIFEAGDTLDAVGVDPLELRLHALNNSARLLETLRRYPESEALMVRSLLLKPEQTDVTQHYVHIRQKQCEWPVYQPVGEVTQNQLLVGTSLLAMHGLNDEPAIQMMSAQRFVNERVAKTKAPPLHAQMARIKPRSGRIKIGYLSGDLHMHAVGLLTAELYELHDRERFEIHAFCWSREDNTPLRARLLKGMDKVWRIGGVSDDVAARLIAEQGIDVLVDLQGLTNGARPNILTQRPAPVQVSYLGLPGTSMVPGIDWILADHFVMQPDYLPFCSEKPIYLPNCYQVSDRKRDVGAAPTRAQYQLPEDTFVYCSFNNNHKMTEETFSAWMRILHAVPNSVLWLLADNDWAKANLSAVAVAAGVDPARLIFAPRVAPPDYLARFALPDLVLDTFPYNAGTTASDCLWMGTPILTRSGQSYISRMCGSLLSAVGLPDLITDSLAEYEARAIQIGRNPARAASYKRYLRESARSSALFDMPKIVGSIEAEFEKLALAARK